MTRVELRDKLKLYHDNLTYYTDLDFNDSIQDGYDEIAAVSGCIVKAVVLPFIANLSFYDFRTLIPDYIGVISIFNPQPRQWMWPTSLGKLEQVEDDWETRIGLPDTFCPISHRMIAIYRKPGVANYGNMWVYYCASAPTVGDNDELVGIPNDYADVAQDYVICDLYEQQQEWTKALGQFKSYLSSGKVFETWMQERRNVDRLKILK